MYADYEFYTETWYGDKLTEETYPKYGSRASDFLDWITRQRIVDNLPTDEKALERLGKACCAAADALFDIDAVRTAQMEAGAAAGVNQSGIIQSISSGGESVSFQASEMEKAVAAGQDGINRYLFEQVRPYLSMLADDSGRYYLYWGL